MIMDEIKSRFSVRMFKDHPVPEDKIEEILEAARLAPSAINVQPWQFIVIRDEETKKKLSTLAQGQPHVASAPVAIMCCADTETWGHDNYSKIIKSRLNITEERAKLLLGSPAFNPALKGKEAVMLRAVEQVTYAISYMTLQAKSSGLDACIIGGILNDITDATAESYINFKKSLNMPDNLILVSLLLIGYKHENCPLPEKDRKSLREIVSFEKFNNR